MHAFKMTISETQNKGKKDAKRVELGKVEVFAPTVAEIIKALTVATPEQATDENGKPIVDQQGNPVPAMDDEGFPIFKEDEANWSYTAVINAVKAKVRQYLQPGSLKLKEGKNFWQNFAELAAAGERGGGAALQNARDCRAAFATWAATLGKKAATYELMNTLFKNNEALSLQSPEMKKRMAEYVGQFAETLEIEDMERFTKTLDKVLEAASVVEVQEEDTSDF